MSRQSDPATKYARDVVAGKILAGKPVRQACQRHLRDLQRKDLVWRLDKANRAIEFFPDLLKLENGDPFELLPFQKFIIGSLFGWYRLDGYRRFRTAYIETGKGSGKTPLAAGVGLYGLVADGEPAAEIYSAATNIEQARIAWQDADRMVSMSDELSELIKAKISVLSIPSDHAVFRPLSPQKRGLDGKRVHMGIIDELHEHPSSIAVDKIRAGTKRRQNALIFEITNSGFDRNSVCWKHHRYSLEILDGIFKNDAWFAYISTLDDGDDWRDPKVWLKANPGLGKVLPYKYLEEQVLEAMQMTSKENIVKRLNFCLWTEQATRWLDMDLWRKGKAKIDRMALKGRRCFGGLDLARVNDFSALCLIFPPIADGEKWKALWWYWVPTADIKRRKEKDNIPYDEWATLGLIEKTRGNVTDFEFIKKRIIQIDSMFDLRGINYDRHFSGEIVQSLQDEGIEMFEMGQGFVSMNTPTCELERMILGELIEHDDEIADWMAGNVVIQQDAAGEKKPDKERSVEKIDGIVALIEAVDLAVRDPESPSLYETQGIRRV